MTSDKSSERPGDDRRLDDPNAEDRDDHPVGTTAGTGAGATAGAVAGAAVGGPVGAVVGGVVGGAVGGAAGHEVAARPEVCAVVVTSGVRWGSFEDLPTRLAALGYQVAAEDGEVKRVYVKPGCAA